MNPFEEFQKGAEQLDKQIGAVAKHFGITDKDLSMINEHKNQIADAFNSNKTLEALQKALNLQAEKAAADPKKLAGYTVAMQQHIAEKTETMKSHMQQKDQDLTMPRPAVG